MPAAAPAGGATSAPDSRRVAYHAGGNDPVAAGGPQVDPLPLPEPGRRYGLRAPTAPDAAAVGPAEMPLFGATTGGSQAPVDRDIDLPPADCASFRDPSGMALRELECTGPNTLALTLAEPADLCVQPGATVTVTLAQSCLSDLVRGYQAFLWFDPTRLTFSSGAYIVPLPYGLPIIVPIAATGPNIDMAAGIDNLGGQAPTAVSADLATLTFTAGMAPGLTNVVFRSHDPPTRFSDPFGQPVVPLLVNSPNVCIDGAAPIITCPPNVSVQYPADVPAPATDYAEFVGQGGAASDAGCGGSVTVTHQGDTADGGARCPSDPLIITRTYRATDCAGNCAECTQEITVADTTPPKHVMFAFVDHFEPLPYNQADWQVNMWVDDYLAMASQHTDADGRHPVHSYFQWFTRSITYGNESYLGDCLIRLNMAAYRGYGEVDYHLHHGVGDERTRTEAEATSDLIDLLSRSMTLYNQRGCLLTAEAVPQQAFAFIHGMWALDNSRLNSWSDPGDPHREYCGVNTELGVLRGWGCYVDYTFPAGAPMTPLLTDSIFYAQDDPFPASYQNAANNTLVAVGQPPGGDLMIVEGPNTRTNIDDVDLPTLARMDSWVGHNVHVVGQDDWVFVKVYTHGCAKNLHQQGVWDAFFGPPMNQFYTAIEAKYNDGVNWKLHYVSAREMYNIIKAAEAGLAGDPGQYRDYVIPRYANMVILTDRKYSLLSYTPRQVVLKILDPCGTVDVSFKEFGLCSGVEESSDQTNWTASDCLTEAGLFGELRLGDATPSRYYRVSGAACPQGDYDHNGLINLADYAFLPDCMTGPGGGPPLPGCEAFDMNGDSDVDLQDFAAFAQAFTGP